MVRLASQTGQHRGIITLMELLVGQPPEPGLLQRRTRDNQRVVDEAGLTAFCETIAVPTLNDGILALSQANGFAGMQSNTVMFGFPHEVAGLASLLGLVRTLDGLEKSVIVHRPGSLPERRPAEPRIVIWWKGAEHNGDLMLLLAHLLRGSPEWSRATVTLKSIVDDPDQVLAREREVRALLSEIRIDATVELHVRHDPEQPIAALIHDYSADADLVFLGLTVRAADEVERYAATLSELVAPLPEVVLVHNSGPFQGKLIG